MNSVSDLIHYGYTASAQEVGNTKLLRITDIQNNQVNWNDVPFCNTSDTEFKNYGLNNRDIMIARTGGTIGKTYIVRNLKEKAVFASYLIRVIPNKYVNEEYIKLYMESPEYWRQLKAKSMGTGQPNVNGNALMSLLLPIPPLNEQIKILERITDFNRPLNKYNRYWKQIDTLDKIINDKIKKSILQYAIQGKLVPQDPSDEPASVLLERIRAEKEQMIKDGKIKRDKNESYIYRGSDNSYYRKFLCIKNVKYK